MLLKLLGIERHKSICMNKDLFTHMVRQRSLLPHPIRINVSVSKCITVSMLMRMEWCTVYFTFLDFLPFLIFYKWNYPLSGKGQNYPLSHSILSHIQNGIKNLPQQKILQVILNSLLTCLLLPPLPPPPPPHYILSMCLCMCVCVWAMCEECNIMTT